MARRLATRLGLVAPSPTVAMAAEAGRLKAQGIPVLDFGVGEPDLATPDAIKRAGIRAIEQDFTHYTPAPGIMELRTAIADFYNARFPRELTGKQVMVGPGAKSVLFSAMMTLVNPGDDVVIVAPYWVSFPEQVRLAGGNPVFAPLSAGDGFTVRAAAIEAALTPATRVLIVNAPCNPTGGILPRDEAGRIARLCVERDLWLIADETYEAFVYDAADALSMFSFADLLGERLIVTAAFSKTWAMTGWRVGYGIASETVINGMSTVQSHDATQAASMCQKAAVAAIKEAADAPAEMLAEYRRRRALILALLEGIPGLRCVPPRGAFYVFPDVTGLLQARGLRNAVELSTALLREKAVALIPGEAFGAPGYVRISYATSPANIEAGMARLKAFAEGA